MTGKLQGGTDAGKMKFGKERIVIIRVIWYNKKVVCQSGGYLLSLFIIEFNL
ncbi:MAG: hypothetical protein ACLRT5_13760 [Lachnospiraceae bacterium]